MSPRPSRRAARSPRFAYPDTMPTPEYIMVLTTCPGDDEAARLAAQLIEKRLAACVQANRISSTYRWQGVVETSEETRLLIKARTADYQKLESFIKAGSSYSNPEVLAIPIIHGSRIYLDWIDEQTASTSGTD